MPTNGLDACLGLVADRRRRKIIHQLRHNDNGQTTIDDLVDRMHTGGSVIDDQPIDKERLTIQLFHAHLPKLADHGIVEFSPENGTVQYQQDEQIETVLDSLPDELSFAHP